VNELKHEGMTLVELLHVFSSEETCEGALLTAKWPNGFTCARCGHSHAYTITTRRSPLFECSACGYQASLRAGTIMEGSGTSLCKWFHSLLLVSLSPSAINAVQLQAAIGVTYKTAWLMLHKLRHTMSQADVGAVMLSGIVRINAAKYGRPHNSSVLRHPQEQPVLVGASVTDEGEPIHIKIKRVADEHLRENAVLSSGARAFIEREVEPDTVDLQCVTARYGSHRFLRLLDVAKQANVWIFTTYHGIGSKHLQAYLDEFGYRMNIILQNTNAGASTFTRLTRLCATTSTLTYSSLIRS
jgi:transposase-like protein